MGLFSLPMGKTKLDHIKSLKANVDLWLYYTEKDVDLDYLLSAMQICLDKAKECPKRK